jgi:hypothetical protein
MVSIGSLASEGNRRAAQAVTLLYTPFFATEYRRTGATEKAIVTHGQNRRASGTSAGKGFSRLTVARSRFDPMAKCTEQT